MIPAFSDEGHSGKIARGGRRHPAWGQGSDAATRPRIVIAEDDYFVALELEAALEADGCEIVGVAASADEAVRLAESLIPDLVVMDIRLVGERDGIEAAIEIYRNCRIRCLFATAHSDQITKSRTQHINPLGWLPKPYTAAKAAEAVRSALSLLKSEDL